MVDLTVEDGNKLKIIYATCVGFYGIDLDNATLFDIYIPAQVCNCNFCNLMSLMNCDM